MKEFFERNLVELLVGLFVLSFIFVLSISDSTFSKRQILREKQEHELNMEAIKAGLVQKVDEKSGKVIWTEKEQ
jgi:hypothetical protein